MPNLKSGNLPKWVDLFNGRDLSGWVDRQYFAQDLSVKDGLLVCTGKPIGVMRSERQYENFLSSTWNGVIWRRAAIPEFCLE